MRPIIKRVKKALLTAFELAEVQADVAQLSTISKLLLTIDDTEAAEEAAAAEAAAAHGAGITTVRHVIVRVQDGWEQHLTDDERRQLQALRASADRRAGVVAPRSPSDSTPDSARGH